MQQKKRKMNKNILVITATLGNRDTLAKTIESVKEIGGERIKHIIVAPGSAIPILKKKYEDIECLAEPKGKGGIYAALNYGFRTYGREYDYLTFINDDDYWLQNYSLLIKAMTNDRSLDMVYGKTRYIDASGNTIGSQSCSNQFKSFIPLHQSGIVLLTQQATLIRSDLYFNIGGFDENYKLVADTKFWARASLMDLKVKYINKECAAYIIQDGQLSSDKVTQAKEHNALFAFYPKTFLFKLLLAKWEFRIKNLPLYLKRVIKEKKMGTYALLFGF